MKSNYPYSHELKPAMSFGNLDLEQLAKDGKMRKVASFLQMQTAKFKTKLAQVKRSVYPSFDGTMLPFYEFTPNHEQKLYAAMIYYHGGGFMYPIQKAMMQNSTLFAANTGIKVFLPEYRLSLNHPCNTTLEDCYTMLKYVYENADILQVDRNKIIVYGDSAGGCLAAGVTLLNRDREAYPLCGQMLLYPVCDNEAGKYESMEQYKNAVWSKNSNEQMWRLYLSRGIANEAYIIPMKSDLHNLPPAYVEPQEMDTLRDEAIAYANKLHKAGNKVHLNLVSGSYHGFDADLKSPLVKRVFEERYAFIKELVG